MVVGWCDGFKYVYIGFVCLFKFVVLEYLKFECFYYVCVDFDFVDGVIEVGM